MVSNKLLYQIRKLLNKIYTPTQRFPFEGKPLLVCGEFYQISSVRAKSVFMFNETETTEGFISRDLWWKFKLAELCQVCDKR